MLASPQTRPAPAGVYGQHLMLRLCDVTGAERLDDPDGINEFLVTLVHAVGMRILDGPRVATEQGDRSHYGHSAIVLLYESHAAVHTYPVRREMFLDLFSCRTFRVADVLSVCGKSFGSFGVRELTLLDRGHHWEAPVEDHLPDWVRHR